MKPRPFTPPAPPPGGPSVGSSTDHLKQPPPPPVHPEVANLASSAADRLNNLGPFAGPAGPPQFGVSLQRVTGPVGEAELFTCFGVWQDPPHDMAQHGTTGLTTLRTPQTRPLIQAWVESTRGEHVLQHMVSPGDQYVDAPADWTTQQPYMNRHHRKRRNYDYVEGADKDGRSMMSWFFKG